MDGCMWIYICGCWRRGLGFGLREMLGKQYIGQRTGAELGRVVWWFGGFVMTISSLLSVFRV